MRSKNSTRIGLIILAVAPFHAAWADDVGTAFTYQGELVYSGIPINGDCDFEFTLWDMAVGGTQILPTLTPTVTVTDGRFTEQLDFDDDAFQGSPRF